MKNYVYLPILQMKVIYLKGDVCHVQKEDRGFIAYRPLYR